MYTLKFSKLSFLRANFIFFSGIFPVLFLLTNATSFSNGVIFLLLCTISFLVAILFGAFIYSEDRLRVTLILFYCLFYVGVFFSTGELGVKPLSSVSIVLSITVGILQSITLLAPSRIIDERTNFVFPKEVNQLLKDSELMPFLNNGNLSQRKLSIPTEEELTKIINILEAEKSLIKESDNYDKIFHSLASKLDKIISSLEISYKNNEKDELTVNNEINEKILELVESTD